MRFRVGVGVLVLSLVFAADSFAQKIPVFVNSTVSDDDRVGETLVFEIKEAIKGSQSFRSVEENEWPYIRYSIVTLPDGEGATFTSQVFLFDDLTSPLSGSMITQTVTTCGRAVVQSCARRYLARIDGAVQMLSRESPALHKRLLAAAK